MPVGIPSPTNSSGVGQKLWEADPKVKAASQMEAFRLQISRKYNLPLDSYAELHQWSIGNLSRFWAEVWDFCQIVGSNASASASNGSAAKCPAPSNGHTEGEMKGDCVLDESVPMDEIPEWFAGAQLNFAENLLRYRDNQTAIISTGEGFPPVPVRLTYRQLYEEVGTCAALLARLGIEKNDVVAAYAPNCSQVVILMLAAASIGAVFTTISPDFGVAAVQDRLSQTQPRLLMACNAVFYNGKVHDHYAKLGPVLERIPSLTHLIVLEWIGEHPRPAEPILPPGSPASLIYYAEAMKDAAASVANTAALKFAALPFNHPLYILYSSGTTGKPKCLVHSAGGTLIQHLKEHRLHGDLRRADVFIQYTTIGWMMWHWMVSALAVGCTLVLYDGSPFRPDPLHLWRLVDQLGITAFGTSAKYIQHLQETHQIPRQSCRLDSLRVVFSTGSPLSPESFRWVYSAIKSDLMLSSITGGTDIISLFAAGNPLLPVCCGEIQCKALGMAIDCFAEDGKPAAPGQPGDLVCTRPFPCMPVFFWGDGVDRKLYRAAYFNRFPHIWHHGDYIWLDPQTGGLLMLGRSDGTLNPAGVRFGSAELYNIISSSFSAQVQDSLAVGVKKEGETDERVYLFLQMRPSHEFSQNLVESIRKQIRESLSPRHIPSTILATPAIPYTINGKKVEVAIKKILSGAIDVPISSVANVESLEFYRDLARQSAR